jgi:hypothetical protein
MLSTAIPLALAALAILVLWAKAIREHRGALDQRKRLLDDAATLFEGCSVITGPDGFPSLEGSLPDGRRVRIELIADTLVFRRLPQLWLKLTLFEKHECRRPRIGALSRPTGAEFYSLVHELPRWIAPPPSEASILMRGDDAVEARHIERAGAAFVSLLKDPAVKEALITPRGVRLIRQASQGDRGNHLILRQVRFPLERISPDLIREALSELEALSQVLGGDTSEMPHPIADDKRVLGQPTLRPLRQLESTR